MNKQSNIVATQSQGAPLDVHDWPVNPRVKLGDLGADPPLPDIAIQLKDMIHTFGRDVMRPAGRELDRMSAADVIAPESPFWNVWKS